MNEFKQKYLRKLKHTARQINKEYEETLQIYNSAKTELICRILLYCEENGVKSPLSDRTEDKKEASQNASEVFLEKEIKDIYKKIAISTHPDKLISLGEKERQEKESLFKKAAEAKGAKNLNRLTQVAEELKINLQDLKFSHLELLEEQIKEKEEKIHEMRGDLAWRWYFLNSKEQKKAIKSICNKGNKSV